ncbi:hypothetical protein [Streptomyces sp. NPDC053431]|uniref:hypothetical protein n=1 Tax=Streptomyces sp. NPDC053431 TaxID=3365703 RepID=UPI0037D16646
MPSTSRIPLILLWAGLVAAAGGAVLSVAGWYGISGERFAERQLPYLASCTLPGAALIVAGAVLYVGGVLADRSEGPGPGPEGAPERAYERGRGRERVGGEGDVSAAPSPPHPPSSSDPPLRVPGGTLAHRPDCPLIMGKPEAVPVGDAVLTPCPVCEPWPR